MAPTVFLCDRRGHLRNTPWCGACQSPCTPACGHCGGDARDGNHRGC